MPLDISIFRAATGGNPELVRESQRRRFASVELVDQIIEKDDKWRLIYFFKLLKIYCIVILFI